MEGKNEITSQIAEEILSVIEKYEDFSSPRSTTGHYFSPFTGLGIPPLPLMTGAMSGERAINPVITKLINFCSQRDGDTFYKQPISIITTVGLPKNVKTKVYEKLLTTAKSFHNYQVTGNAHIWLGKSTASDKSEKTVVVIDIPSDRNPDEFQMLLPLLFLISNTFIISSSENIDLESIKASKKLSFEFSTPQLLRPYFELRHKQEFLPNLFWVSETEREVAIPSRLNEHFDVEEIITSNKIGMTLTSKKAMIGSIIKSLNANLNIKQLHYMIHSFISKDRHHEQGNEILIGNKFILTLLRTSYEHCLQAGLTYYDSAMKGKSEKD